MAKPNRNYNGQWEDYVVENGYPEWRQESQANYLQHKCLSPGHKAVSLRVLRKLRFHGKLPYLKKKKKSMAELKQNASLVTSCAPYLDTWLATTVYFHSHWLQYNLNDSSSSAKCWSDRALERQRESKWPVVRTGVFWVMVHNEQADHLNPQGNKVEKAKQNTNEPSTWV